MVDLRRQQVIVYQFSQRSIGTVTAYKDTDTIASVCFEGLVVGVKDLFEDLPVTDFIDAD